MAKAVFGTTFLGDSLVWLGSDYERLSTDAKRLLWSNRAYIDDSSPNFLWRVKIVVAAKRTDTVTLAAALETLAKTTGGAKGDLKIYADDGQTLLRMYRSCRFDGMRRSEGPKASRRDFEDDILFVFTTEEDPE